MQSSYRGRFAPSPTGALHAGSLVAALASWLDARAHKGQWLVRIEDVDTPRCVKGADQTILQQLALCGLHSDEPVIWQSQRLALYERALAQLKAQNRVYPCACSRKDVELALQHAGAEKPRHGELVYPGTCRAGLQGKPSRAWRFLADDIVHWTDRRLGIQQQQVAQEVGDFVLQRADGLFAYQLAVVVDDAAQGITHVVRGEDLADNTARQLLLQNALNYAVPRYLHTPLILGADGEKLSKQNGAIPLQLKDPLAALNSAAAALGLPAQAAPMEAALSHWTAAWAARWTD
jgi:glutamyl-Q tRNA(Asp) synthetase